MKRVLLIWFFDIFREVNDIDYVSGVIYLIYKVLDLASYSLLIAHSLNSEKLLKTEDKL